jgi:putative transposase
MVEYKQNSHSVWDVKYHVIWVTKYRFKVLRGEVAVRLRDLLRQVCQGRDVVIVQGSVSPDRVHMLVSVPPQLAPAKLVQYMKGRSNGMLQDEFPQLRKRY